MARVMIDARYLGPRRGGIGRYCFELIRAMSALDPSLRLELIVRKEEHASGVPNERVVAFDAEAYGPATSLLLARRIGRSPDLFHSPFHVLPLGLEAPGVLTMHDVFNFDQPRFSNYPFPVSWIEWAYFLAAIPVALRRARVIICVSRTTADALGARIAAVRPKLRVIPHGVAALFRVAASSAGAAARREALLGDDAPFVLSLGGISPNKNHQRIVRAFAAAFPAPSRHKLVTVSRFGDPRRLRKLARELGIEGRLVTIDCASDEDLVTLLNTAELLAFLSIEEGFGIPVLEAMAAGCPVLTSNVSCLPEVGGDAAAYADPFDVAAMAAAMRRLAANEGERAELRERGLERARAFTWERAARETLAVYDEVLRSG